MEYSSISRNKKVLRALRNLSENEDFDNISIVDICNESKYSRVTFYRNYKDKPRCVMICIGLVDGPKLKNIKNVLALVDSNITLLNKVYYSDSGKEMMDHIETAIRTILAQTAKKKGWTEDRFESQVEHVLGCVHVKLSKYSLEEILKPSKYENDDKCRMSNADKVVEKAKKKRYAAMSEELIDALKSRQYEVYYCDNREEAKDKILALIPANSSVSWGGSLTLEQIEVLDDIRNGPYEVLDTKEGKTPEERYDIMRRAFSVDYYLTGFNGVAMDGTIFNIDGNGNRVAAITFGPKYVIAVVGMNKVCMTTEMALARAETIAAQMNACRFGDEDTLFTNQDVTQDCLSPKSMCNFIEQMTFCRTPKRIKIILVAEDLGF